MLKGRMLRYSEMKYNANIAKKTGASIMNHPKLLRMETPQRLLNVIPYAGVTNCRVMNTPTPRMVIMMSKYW